MKIFLVRHGEVEGNSGPHPTFSGWNDVPLTARGELQARAVAACLQNEELHAIHSSDLSRARETAQCIAEPHKLEVETSASWRETDYGAWSGLGEAEIARGWSELWERKKADQFGIAAPDGENGEDLARRLLPRWEEVVEEARCAHASTRDATGATVLVAHNGPLRLLVCHLMGAPLSNFRRIKMDNCGVTCVTFGARDRSPQLLFVNSTCHLKGV